MGFIKDKKHRASKSETLKSVGTSSPLKLGIINNSNEALSVYFDFLRVALVNLNLYLKVSRACLSARCHSWDEM